jgi:hypothetical protein
MKRIWYTQLTIAAICCLLSMTAFCDDRVQPHTGHCETECNLTLYLLAPNLLNWGVAHYVDAGLLVYPPTLDAVLPGLNCPCQKAEKVAYSYKRTENNTRFTVLCPVSAKGHLRYKLITSEGLATSHQGVNRQVGVAQFLGLRGNLVGRFSEQRLGKFQLLVLKGKEQPRVVVLNPTPLMKELMGTLPGAKLSESEADGIVRRNQISDPVVLRALR